MLGCGEVGEEVEGDGKYEFGFGFRRLVVDGLWVVRDGESRDWFVVGDDGRFEPWICCAVW